MAEEKSVAILLATYNGQKYLQEQLDSIISNSYSNLALIISDDGSTDETLNILRIYKEKYSYIKVIDNTSSQHGAFYNFANLIKYIRNNHISADYYMFSDQDDFWKNEKISLSVQEILKHDDCNPILVYTSKDYVDDKLNPILFNVPKEDSFDYNILHQNKTFGCTYIFNNALLEILEPTPPEFFINYDHYVAFQGFLFGKVYYLPEKTILYRQHGDNVSGVVNKSFIKKLNFKNKYEKNIALYKNLIDYMYKKKKMLKDKDRNLIERLYKVKDTKLGLFFTSLFMNIRKNTPLGTFQFYLTILFVK